MRDAVLIRCADPAVLDRVVAQAVALVECGTAPEVWRHAGAGLALVQATAPGAAERIAIHQTRHEAFSYVGFVADAALAPGDVRRRVSLEGDPVMAHSPGGVATYFVADARRRRVIAWSSHAGLQGPYYTVGADCTAISNRPLLSHLVGRQSDRPAFSPEWARRALLGPSLWDDTPFEGTRQAPPRSALVADDDIRFAPHPVPLDRRFEKRDPAAVEALVATGLAAVAPLRRWPRGELWLSGGKDSRMVLALVRRAGIDIDIVTHARPGAGEGEAAGAVAAALGVEHRVIEGEGIATADDLLPTVLANLRRTDGLIGEARILAYRVAPHLERPVVQGQAHHPRGGFRVRLSDARAEMAQQLRDPILGDRNLVIDPIGAERAARLDEILAGYSDPRSLAYWLYADWRMSRWTTAAHAAATRQRAVLWPMVDERVLQVTAAIRPDDRASEVAFFAALVHLAPELAGVPLYRSNWRFDGGRHAGTRFPDSYESRRTPFEERGRGRTAERRVATIQPLLHRALHETRSGPDLARLIRPEILRALCDEPDPALALGLPHMQIINVMWRLTAVALVLEGAWLTT